MSNFIFIIGCQKSGTNFLAKILNFQDDIHILCKKPETKIIKKFKYSGFDILKKKCNNKKFVGEKVTSYSEDKDVIKLINKKNIKLIFIIREPINRAFSHYIYSKKNKIEKNKFENTFYLQNRKNPNLSMNPYLYFERGKYFKTLNKFNFKILKIVILENILKNQNEYYKLCKWIGLKKIKKIPKKYLIYKKNNNLKNINKNFMTKLCKYYQVDQHKLAKKFKLNLKIWKKYRNITNEN